MIKNKKILIILFVLAFILLGLGGFLKNKYDQKDDIQNTDYVENKISAVPFAMPLLSRPQFPENICNIRDYGAVGDGTIINTQPIKDAIADCAQKGGGKIIFPKGKWLTGPIHLRSNLNLYLEKDSEIIFTTNLDDYLPLVFSKFQGMEYYGYSPPIYAKDCENIALTGSGKISGQGDFWEEWAGTDNSKKNRDKLFRMSQANVPAEQRIFKQKNSGLRPSFVQFINCRNIFIEGLTLDNGPMWTLHPIYSENIIIRKVKIQTHSINTDGIVIDSSRNVLIENSVFSTGDDAIAIKSGLEAEGLRVNRPSENIVIQNSRFGLGHGALSIGSEMSGGVRNVFFSDSFLDGTDSGLRIKTTSSRGGFVENIWLKNIEMQNIKNEAFSFDFNYKTALSAKILRPPSLKNIYVENITGESVKKVFDILGLPGSQMENIFFKDLRFQSEKGSDLENVKNIEFQNIYLQTASARPSLKLKNSQQIKLDNFQCENSSKMCLNIEGRRTSHIDLKNSGLKEANISLEEGLKKAVIFAEATN